MRNGGYFAEDKTAADEATAQEVEEILFGKKQLLSFKDAAGNWNVRRFLFSKWTLREGWDNPNVFTIAKLRSCGSEEKLEEVAKKRGTTSAALFAELLAKGLVDVNRKIVSGRQGTLLVDYPEFVVGAGLKRGSVRDRNKKPDARVHVRKEQFAALKGLWEKLNQRYMLFFRGETGAMLEKALPSLCENDVFVENTLQCGPVHLLGANVRRPQDRRMLCKQSRFAPEKVKCS